MFRGGLGGRAGVPAVRDGVLARGPALFFFWTGWAVVQRIPFCCCCLAFCLCGRVVFGRDERASGLCRFHSRRQRALLAWREHRHKEGATCRPFGRSQRAWLVGSRGAGAHRHNRHNRHSRTSIATASDHHLHQHRARRRTSSWIRSLNRHVLRRHPRARRSFVGIKAGFRETILVRTAPSVPQVGSSPCGWRPSNAAPDAGEQRCSRLQMCVVRRARVGREHPQSAGNAVGLHFHRAGESSLRTCRRLPRFPALPVSLHLRATEIAEPASPPGCPLCERAATSDTNIHMAPGRGEENYLYR